MHDASMSSLRCPCGGDSYEACCGRFHAGAEPTTPEELMRSRYSAFVKRDAAYLWKTLHPDHDERADEARFQKSIREHFTSRLVYRGLTILGTTEPDAEGVATVTFRASVEQRGRDRSFSERSLFVHDGTGWRYLTGTIS